MTIKKTCPCGAEFNVEDGMMAKLITYCGPCLDRRAEEHQEQERLDKLERKRRQWEAICSPDYRTVDLKRLPRPEKLREVMAWTYGPEGLVLHGDTALGKTRCIWQLLAREFSLGRSIGILDSMSGLRYAALYSESPQLVLEWAEGLIEKDIVLMDDVFKNKLTDSFEGVIFTIIDQRAQNQRPIFLTSNDTGVTLASRMSADRSDPLVRRVRENCKQIKF